MSRKRKIESKLRTIGRYMRLCRRLDARVQVAKNEAIHHEIH
jgi:hypothetical protein